MAMQPFDRHPADVGSLQGCGSTLVASAADSFENGTATRQAYQPAVTNWTGSCAPEIATANDPVQSGAAGASSALAWAAVVTEYWGSQVQAFNAEVDRIVVPVKDPPAGQTPEQAQNVLQHARTAWWTAYDTFIETGGNRAATMLREGPNRRNVRLAKDAGVLPQSTNDVWDDIWNAGKGWFLPSDALGWPGYASWGFGKGGMAFGANVKYLQQIQIGRFAPRNALGRFVSPGDLTWWQRAAAVGEDSNWIPKSGQAGAYSRWGTAGKWAGRAGVVVGFATGAWDQWTRDEDDPSLDTTAKAGRAAWRGGLTAAGGWAGATAGAEAGAAIGSLFPGPGTVIGGVVGGIVGGVVGSGLGGSVADATVDFAGDVADEAGDIVDDIGGAISSIF
jgi:hypothetical protein